MFQRFDNRHTYNLINAIVEILLPKNIYIKKDISLVLTKLVKPYGEHD